MTPYSYCIFSDSTNDYPETLPREPQFDVIPMTYYMNGVLYDGASTPFLPIDDFYAAMKDGACPQTSLITPQVVKDFFTPSLKDGYDVFYLCFSSAMSGSYKSACTVVEELRKEFPERKIEVADSRAATLGEGFYTYLLLEKRKAGASFDELCAYAAEIRDNVVHLLMVDDLYHLARGGRISKTAAVAGTAINLKPVLIVAQDGSLKCTNSMVGRRLALKMILSKAEQKAASFDHDTAFVGYATEKGDAEWLKNRLEKQLGYRNVVVGRIGAVIGSHTGPGMVGAFFLGSDKN